MGRFRPFDTDPITGAVTLYEDLGEDGFALHTVQDCEPALDFTKERRSAGTASWSGDLRLEAHIPDIIALKWFAEEGIKVWDPGDTPKVVAKLNDPDWRYLKTFDGRIGTTKQMV